MSLQDVEGVLNREGINGYGVMAKSGPEVNLSHCKLVFPCWVCEGCSENAPIVMIYRGDSRGWSQYGQN